MAIDLFCGLGGWTEGFLAEGYTVIGFDIERRPYPSQLVLQDVLTIHGSQFKNAAAIVASPPCQAYSYRAMPWKKAKALPPPDNSLFEACFRIQREAIKATQKECSKCARWLTEATMAIAYCDACGGTGFLYRHIPLVVENVKGAQPWVGRAKWHYGSFYLWGDVPALMPQIYGVAGYLDFQRRDLSNAGIKGDCGAWFNDFREKGIRSDSIKRLSYTSSKSPARKAASAKIAKIPFPLAQHIARCFHPGVSLLEATA